MKLISFLWVIFLIRKLPLEIYGRYSYINSLLAIFAVVPDFGVGLILIREIAKRKYSQAVILSNGIYITLVQIVIAVVGIVGMTLVLNVTHYAHLIFLASLSLVFSSLRLIPISLLEGLENMKKIAVLNTANTLLQLSGMAFGYYFFHSLEGLFAGFAIGTALSSGFTWFSAKLPTFSLQYDSKIVWKIVRSSLPLGIASISFMIYSRADTLILGLLMSEKAVGTYNTAYPLVFGIIQLLNVPFSSAIFPTLSRHHAQDTRRFKIAIAKAVSYVLLWSVPVSICIAIFASQINQLLFSKIHNEAVEILRIMIFIVPVASLSAVLYKILIVIEKQKIYLAVSILGALLSVGFNYFLIPQFGVVGSALSAIGTHTSLMIIYGLCVGYLTRKL